MKSIRSKLWTGMMALIVIVLILLWLFQIVFLESFYTNIRIANVKKEANSIINKQSSISNPNFKDQLDEFAFKNNLSMEFINKAGNTVYTVGYAGFAQMPMMRNNSARLEVFGEGIKGKTAAIQVTHPRFENKIMLIGLPVIFNEELSGVLILNMPIAAVEETASILKWQLFYITIILLIFSLLISYLISRNLSRPLTEIKKVTDKMASGDFSASIDNINHDEIGELADRVNYLGKQLCKIEQLRKDIIANVSHELRTPLSLIRGYAETIRDISGNNTEKRDRQIRIVIEETERLSKIVDDILNLSQLQSGYIELNKTVCDVRDIFNIVAKRYEDLSEKTGISITMQSLDESCFEADEARMEQVFYNLINNAFNHTSEGGKITVMSINKNDRIRFEISDSGSGISEEELPYIWNRYYKAEKTSSKKAVGTGLGLAIVKELLEAHGADYGVQSKLNSGTTFWFEIKKC